MWLISLLPIPLASQITAVPPWQPPPHSFTQSYANASITKTSLYSAQATTDNYKTAAITEEIDEFLHVKL
jgi:hypothetical protein